MKITYKFFIEIPMQDPFFFFQFYDLYFTTHPIFLLMTLIQTEEFSKTLWALQILVAAREIF